MNCFRCTLIKNPAGIHPAVGVCSNCWVMVCELDGDLVERLGTFRCCFCLGVDLLASSGLIHLARSGGDDDEGGSPGGDRAPRPHGPGGGGSGGAAIFVGSRDFESQVPTLAEQSAEHRAFVRPLGASIIERLRRVHSDASEQERTAARLELLGDDRESADRALNELADSVLASGPGGLSAELLSDAIGLATWSMGLRPGEEPSRQQLRFLPDERLRVLIAAYAPVSAVAYA